MQKSADAFRTISEVADDLTLPQHVLRFWETRFPQIRPLKRAGGRRYYRPADVLLLKAIRQLLYDDGYTIKGVQRLIKEQGTRGLGAPPPGEIAGLNPDFEESEADEARAPADDVVPATDLEPFATDRTSLAQALREIEACTRILDALSRT